MDSYLLDHQGTLMHVIILKEQQLVKSVDIAHLYDRYVCILIDGMSQDAHRIALGDPHVLFFTPMYTTRQYDNSRGDNPRRDYKETPASRAGALSISCLFSLSKAAAL